MLTTQIEDRSNSRYIKYHGVQGLHGSIEFTQFLSIYYDNDKFGVRAQHVRLSIRFFAGIPNWILPFLRVLTT